MDTDASMSDAPEHRQEEEMVSLTIELHFALYLRRASSLLMACSRKSMRLPTTQTLRTPAPLLAVSPESPLQMAESVARRLTNYVEAFLEGSTIAWASPRFEALRDKAATIHKYADFLSTGR